MKTLAMTLFLLSAFLAGAQIPDADLDKISKADIIATLQHLQRNEKEAQARATEAELHEKATLSSLQTITRENMGLQTALDTAARSAAALEQHDAAQTVRANAEAERADKAQKLAAHRGNILGMLCGALGVFIGLQLIRIFPTIPYAWAAPVAGFGIGYFAARLLL